MSTATLVEEKKPKMSKEIAWARQGWVAPGVVVDWHFHRCIDCDATIICFCDDHFALWTDCSLHNPQPIAEEKAA